MYNLPCLTLIIRLRLAAVSSVIIMKISRDHWIIMIYFFYMYIIHLFHCGFAFTYIFILLTQHKITFHINNHLAELIHWTILPWLLIVKFQISFSWLISILCSISKGFRKFEFVFYWELFLTLVRYPTDSQY